MSARPGKLSTDAVLPSLATDDDVSAAPQTLAAAARTGTDIEMRIQTSITLFGVAAEPWFPATADVVVTVIVHTLDAATFGQEVSATHRARRVGAGDILHQRRRARILHRRRRPEHRHPRTQATRVAALPRHRPAADTPATAACHLPALSPT